MTGHGKKDEPLGEYYNLMGGAGSASGKSECSETESARPLGPSSPSSAEFDSLPEPSRPPRNCDIDERPPAMHSYCNLPTMTSTSTSKPLPEEPLTPGLPPPSLPRRQPHVKQQCTSPVTRRTPPPPPLSSQMTSTPNTVVKESKSTSTRPEGEAVYQNQCRPTSTFRRKESSATMTSGSPRRRRPQQGHQGGHPPPPPPPPPQQSQSQGCSGCHCKGSTMSRGIASSNNNRLEERGKTGI